MFWAEVEEDLFWLHQLPEILHLSETLSRQQIWSNLGK